MLFHFSLNTTDHVSISLNKVNKKIKKENKNISYLETYLTRFANS